MAVLIPKRKKNLKSKSFSQGTGGGDVQQRQIKCVFLPLSPLFPVLQTFRDVSSTLCPTFLKISKLSIIQTSQARCKNKHIIMNKFSWPKIFAF